MLPVRPNPALLILVAATSACWAGEPLGAATISSDAPFSPLQLDAAGLPAPTLDPGELRIAIDGRWISIWAKDDESFEPTQGQYGRYFLDYETAEASVDVSWGLADGIELWAGVSQSSRFGGELDGLVESFHDLFGLDPGQRDQVPDDQFNIRVQPEGGEAIRLTGDDRGPFTSDLTLGLGHRLFSAPHGGPTLYWSAAIRLFDAPGEVAGDPIDAGLSAGLFHRGRRWSGRLAGGVFRQGSEAVLGVSLRRVRFQMAAALSWEATSRWSLYLTGLSTQGIARRFAPWDEPSHEVELGAALGLGQRSVVRVGLVENVASRDNGPDFGLRVGWSHRLAGRAD